MKSVSQSASHGLEQASARLARSARNVVVNNLGIAKNTTPTVSESVKLYLSGELPKSVLNPAAELPAPPEAVQAHSQEPEVDLAREQVQQVSAVQAFKASVAVLQSEDERSERLLEVVV